MMYVSEHNEAHSVQKLCSAVGRQGWAAGPEQQCNGQFRGELALSLNTAIKLKHCPCK